MIHSLLPVFLVSTLGVSVLGVGIIEGIAEGTASIMKLFSGVLSAVSKRCGGVALGCARSKFNFHRGCVFAGLSLVGMAAWAQRKKSPSMFGRK
jgi:hypothetical protein